jgi:predicted transposase YbfD/YdcC
MSTSTPSIIGFFNILPDPRRLKHNTRLHDLTDIVVIAVLAIIAGAEGWEDVESFGIEKETWLKTFCSLKNGIPSHDTFGRVFSIIRPDAFQSCFRAWTQSLATLTPGTVVALDGKTVRRSFGPDSKAAHIVSAYATELGLTLGQMKVDEKSNEITAIPELLDMLVLKGCIVTMDAMGTQSWFATKIKAQSADYVLALKGNQGKIHKEVIRLFDTQKPTATAETHDKGHGRIEYRVCDVIDDLSSLESPEKWEGLQSLVRVTEKRTSKEVTTAAVRYFISSLPPNASNILRAVREHWGIENRLHWSLDVQMREDYSRVHIKHAAENFSLLRKFALNMLRLETSSKKGVRAKRFRAGLSEEYLMKVVMGGKTE